MCGSCADTEHSPRLPPQHWEESVSLAVMFGVPACQTLNHDLKPAAFVLGLAGELDSHVLLECRALAPRVSRSRGVLHRSWGHLGRKCTSISLGTVVFHNSGSTMMALSRLPLAPESPSCQALQQIASFTAQARGPNVWFMRRYRA